VFSIDTRNLTDKFKLPESVNSNFLSPVLPSIVT